MITPQMLEGIGLWENLKRTFGWNGPQLADLERHRMIRELVGSTVTDLVRATDQRLNAAAVGSPLDIQKLETNVVGYREESQRHHRELKDFLFANLYSHFRVLRMAMKAEKVISDLFQAYQTDPAILPAGLETAVEKRGLERTICDYIAGMTDRFAIQEHRKLFDPLESP
jgi:dGTPase